MTTLAPSKTARSVLKNCLFASASAGIIATMTPAHATDFLSFTTAGDFTGWTQVSTSVVVATNNTVAITLGDGIHGPYTTYKSSPAAGQYMATIWPGSSITSSTFLNHADAVFGLTTNTFSSIFSGLSGSPTNYGALIETTTLNAGTTYTFYWSYAAQDYKPFNDGVFFTLAGNGINAVNVLASNGGETSDRNGGGAQISTNVVGTFGVTQWASYSIIVPTTGSYTLGFGAYNWADSTHPNDTGSNPIFFVGAAAGTVTSAAPTTPIDTNSAYYNLTNIGTSVTPDFKGGTLRVDTSAATAASFAVETFQGNAIDAYGHIGLFSGTFEGNGGLTIKDSASGGKIIFTGNAAYTGGTTIAQGATLQIGNGGTTGTIAGDITNDGTLAFNRSDSVTYSGEISGNGSLVQAGTGTLVLTGANHYSGGTLISSGTLQIGDGGTTGSLIGTITNNGTLIYNISGNYGHSSTISGSGQLIKQGSGTLILVGADSVLGGTTISSGTLQIGNGGTVGSIAGNIANNSALTFNRSGSLTYDGVISGTGTMSVTGGGTIILTGANTYTGKTIIAAGSTLQIGNGGVTGSIVSDVTNNGALAFNRSDNVTFNGTITGNGTLVQNGTGKVIVTTNYTGKTIVNSGTLQIGNGAASGTVTGDIVNSGAVIYGQAASTTYSGVISGSGSLAVSGGGVVTLNNANLYTGPTTVTAGSLLIGDSTHQLASVLSGVTVSNNAIVGGYGTIAGNLTANGGVVSPGGSIGTLRVAGNYTASAASTLAIEIAPGTNDKLVVGGVAQLGGTLALSLASGSYNTGSVALLTAGSISGTFANVTYSGATDGMVYGIVYGPNEVDLAMTPAASGQIYGDLVTQSIDTAYTLNRATIDHLDVSADTGWNVWTKTLAGTGRANRTSSVASFNSQLWGVISGADYQFTDGTKLSGVFSYTRNQLGVHGENDKASADGYFFALAGRIPLQNYRIDLSGFMQHSVIGTTRDQGASGSATGRTTNLVGGGSVQVGYPLNGGNTLPFARLSVASIGTEAFTEAGSLGFAVDSVARTSVRGTVGVSFSHTFTTENNTQIVPHILVGVEQEFGESRRDTPMTFANTRFVAAAVVPDNTAVLISTGVSAKLAQQLEVSFETSGRASTNQVEGQIAFGAKYRF